VRARGSSNISSTALKIAYFINQYPQVSHSFIRREILALERRGFAVHRIALRDPDPSFPDADDRSEWTKTRYILKHGVWGLLLPTLRVALQTPGRFASAVALAVKLAMRSGGRLPYHLIYVAEACAMLSMLRKSGVQHIHAHFGTNSAEVAMLASVLGEIPYSFTVHGPEEFSAPMGLDEKIRRAKFVVAISSFGRSQLFLRSPFEDWEKIKVVHCGLEPGFHAGIVPDTVDAPRFVCVGRLCEAKGQLLLIQAVAHLAAEGVVVNVVLAGDGPMRAQIESAIVRYGLSEHVRITGWISSADVRREILGARALILPTFAEGLPVVIMEAMALSRPILSTYVAGIPELVVSGESGWLFAAGSIQELAAAMQDCLGRSTADMQRMGASARERVILRHSIDVEAGKLAALFELGKT
jgi:colanic acid/amylovoran biosynthesis glycosyltransferase